MPNKAISELKNEVEIPRIEGEVIGMSDAHYLPIIEQVRAHVGVPHIKGSECLIYLTDLVARATSTEKHYTIVFQREVTRRAENVVLQTTVLDKVVWRSWIEFPDGVDAPPKEYFEFLSVEPHQILGTEVVEYLEPEEYVPDTIPVERPPLVLD